MFLGNCVTDLCYICTGNRECRRCRRRLPIHLFQGDLCRACRNIDPSHIGRYALGGYVEEHEFLGDNGDVSVDDFVRRHADAVTSTFNEAKNYLCLKFEKFLSRSKQFIYARPLSHPIGLCFLLNLFYSRFVHCCTNNELIN